MFDLVSSQCSVISVNGSHSRSQEISIILPGNLPGEVLRRKVELVALGSLGGQLLRLLLEQLERVRLVDTLALGRGNTVAHPLPQLAARDLGSRRVLPTICVSARSCGPWGCGTNMR